MLFFFDDLVNLFTLLLHIVFFTGYLFQKLGIVGQVLQLGIQLGFFQLQGLKFLLQPRLILLLP